MSATPPGGTACPCPTTQRLAGDPALELTAHLRLVSADDEGWSAIWRCPETGAEWLETHLAARRREDPSTRIVRISMEEPVVPSRPRWTPARAITIAISLLLAAAIAAGSLA